MITQEDINKYLGKYFKGSWNEFSIPEENIKLSVHLPSEIKHSSRELYPSHPSRDKFLTFLEYLDRSDRDVRNDALWKIFNEIFGEATDGETAQWGTWKFPLKTPKDLIVLKKILDKYLHAKNFKEADVKDSE